MRRVLWVETPIKPDEQNDDCTVHCGSNSVLTLLLFLCCLRIAAGTAAYIMDAPPMFTFHHVNAFTTAAPGSSNGNGSSNGSRRKQQLVLDTVAWDEVAFENNQVCDRLRWLRMI
jgi:hypothetical protein